MQHEGDCYPCEGRPSAGGDAAALDREACADAEGAQGPADAGAQQHGRVDGDQGTVEAHEQVLEELLVQDADALEPARVEVPERIPSCVVQNVPLRMAV